MNKIIASLFCLLALIICVSCGSAVSETEQTGESGEALLDEYLSVLEGYSLQELCVKTVFSVEFEGAAEQTGINITRNIAKTEEGYCIQDENGDILVSGEELSDELMRQGSYIEPYGGDIDGELSDGVTTFECSPDISQYRGSLLGSSVFFEGYEALSEESVQIKDLKYTARSQNGELVCYEYTFDLTVSDEGAYFTAHIAVKTDVTA